MTQNLPKRSLGDVLSLRHPNHFVLAGANNRPTDSSRPLFKQIKIFFFIDCMTVCFNYKYFPEYTRELLECLLGISPFGGSSVVKTDCQGSCFIRQRSVIYGIVAEVCVYCDFWRVLGPV